MSEIFESPDGGHTVYKRNIGERTRQLVSQDDFALRQKEKIEWGRIYEIKDTNPTLQKAVEQILTIYRLIDNE